jgi:hypothetical protein
LSRQKRTVPIARSVIGNPVVQIKTEIETNIRHALFLRQKRNLRRQNTTLSSSYNKEHEILTPVSSTKPARILGFLKSKTRTANTSIEDITDFISPADINLDSFVYKPKVKKGRKPKVLSI